MSVEVRSGTPPPVSDARAAHGARIRLVTIACLAIFSILVLLIQSKLIVFTDFEIFRDGGTTLLHGGSLYDDIRGGPDGAPFIYPPFAAVLMIPFALVPLGVGWIIWVLLCGAALFGTAYLVAIRLPVLSGGAIPDSRWLITWVIFTFAVLSEPVSENMLLGQVNIFVMFLLLLDTVTQSRWTGVLTGLVAGFKVIPGLFIVLMLLTRRWSDAVRALAALAATIVLGALFGFGQAWRFWTDFLFGVNGLVDAYQPGNASLLGVFHRWLPDSLALIAWLVSAVIVGCAVLYLATQWWRRDKLVSACVIALGALLVSPIAWDHHWVWLTPLAGVLFALYRRAHTTTASSATRMWLFISFLAVISTCLLHGHRIRILVVDQPGLFINTLSTLYALTAVLALVALTQALPLAPKPDPTASPDVAPELVI